MKARILTNTKIKPEWLEELASYVDWEIEVEKTKKVLPAKLNPYFGKMWGDFDWLRQNVGDADIRVFVTTDSSLKAKQITGHIGMYDLTDSDSKLDFYIGLPDELDKRAKKNGFKYNFTWLVLHEYLHGEEQQNGTPDRVDTMDDQGRLKELLTERQTKYKQRLTIIDILKTIRELLKKKPKIHDKYPTELRPLVQRAANELVAEFADMGHPIRIVEGVRSCELQNKYYAKGRTLPGKKITNAKCGESLHQYGLAFDVVFRKEGYTASDELWGKLGDAGEELGLEWGGRWPIVDKPHFSLTLGYSLADFQNDRVDWSKWG